MHSPFALASIFILIVMVSVLKAEPLSPRDAMENLQHVLLKEGDHATAGCEQALKDAREAGVPPVEIARTRVKWALDWPKLYSYPQEKAALEKELGQPLEASSNPMDRWLVKKAEIVQSARKAFASEADRMMTLWNLQRDALALERDAIFYMSYGWSNQLPESVRHILDHADSIVLYALADPGTKGERFHNYPIAQQKVLSSDQRLKAVQELRSLVEEWEGTMANCFDPHQALRVVGKGKTYDFLICHHCAQMQIYGPELKRPVTLGIGGSAAGLDALLHDGITPPEH